MAWLKMNGGKSGNENLRYIDGQIQAKNTNGEWVSVYYTDCLPILASLDYLNLTISGNWKVSKALSSTFTAAEGSLYENITTESTSGQTFTNTITANNKLNATSFNTVEITYSSSFVLSSGTTGSNACYIDFISADGTVKKTFELSSSTKVYDISDINENDITIRLRHTVMRGSGSHYTQASINITKMLFE